VGVGGVGDDAADASVMMVSHEYGYGQAMAMRWQARIARTSEDGAGSSERRTR
jgi:hypothetical protein